MEIYLVLLYQNVLIMRIFILKIKINLNQQLLIQIKFHREMKENIQFHLQINNF